MRVIEINELLYHPDIKTEVVNIFGFDFNSIINTPKVFVVKTKEIVDFEDIDCLYFEYKQIKCTLQDVIIHKKEDLVYFECRKWSMEYPFLKYEEN